MTNSFLSRSIKTLSVIAAIFVSALCVAGQRTQVEADFEKNRARYKVESFSEGEDASSGYDYLFYKRGESIVKIRSIWSASHSKELRIEDMYFHGDDVLLVRKFTAASGLLNTLKKGRQAQMAPKEEFHFSSGKLSKWVQGNTSRLPADKEWPETEKAILEHARSQRDYYKWLKEGTF